MSQQNPSPSDKCVGCGHPRFAHVHGQCHAQCSWSHFVTGVHVACTQVDGDACSLFVERATPATPTTE
jgi:hypothetical protein